jgi:hypothetical protein
VIPLYLFDKTLDGHRFRSGLFGEEKNLLSLLEIETPTANLVT